MISFGHSTVAVKFVVGAFVSFILMTILFQRSSFVPSSSPLEAGLSTHKLSIRSRIHRKETPELKGVLHHNSELKALCSRYHWEELPGRKLRRRLFDLVMVNDDLDALTLRMRRMNEVDYFLIVESHLTPSGLAKPLYVHEHWDHFEEFHPKMVLLALNTTDQISADLSVKQKLSQSSMLDFVSSDLPSEKAPLEGDITIEGDLHDLVHPEVLQVMRNCQPTIDAKPWAQSLYRSLPWFLASEDTRAPIPGAANAHESTDTDRIQGIRDGNKPATKVFAVASGCRYCFPWLQELVIDLKSIIHREADVPWHTSLVEILQREWYGFS